MWRASSGARRRWLRRRGRRRSGCRLVSHPHQSHKGRGNIPVVGTNRTWGEGKTLHGQIIRSPQIIQRRVEPSGGGAAALGLDVLKG
eukprot:645603-Prorocentrum_minimum.AAC.1